MKNNNFNYELFHLYIKKYTLRHPPPHMEGSTLNISRCPPLTWRKAHFEKISESDGHIFSEWDEHLDIHTDVYQT